MRIRAGLNIGRRLFCSICGIVLMVLGITILIVDVLGGPVRRDLAQVAVSIILIVLGYNILLERKVSLTALGR